MYKIPYYPDYSALHSALVFNSDYSARNTYVCCLASDTRLFYSEYFSFSGLRSLSGLPPAST